VLGAVTGFTLVARFTPSGQSRAESQLVAADSVRPQKEINATKLMVALEFKSGKPLVKRNASALEHSPMFLKRLRLSPEELCLEKPWVTPLPYSIFGFDVQESPA